MSEITVRTKNEFTSFVKNVTKGRVDYTEIKICCTLKVADAKVLATILPRLSALKTLDLSDNKITPEVIQLLAAALAQLTNLERLDLHLNTLGDAGAAIVAMAIIKCGRLKFLGLDHNNISNHGAMFVATAIAKSKALEDVNFFNHIHIGLVGLNGLALAIVHSPTLQRLNLGCCGIPPAAAKNLAVAYAYSKSMQTLSIDDIPNIRPFHDFITRLNATRFAPQMLAFMAGSFRRKKADAIDSPPLTALEKFLARDGDNAITHRTYRMLFGQIPTIPLTSQQLTTTLDELYFARGWPRVIASPKPAVVLS